MKRSWFVFMLKYCLKLRCVYYMHLYVLQAIELAQIMDESLDENNIELVLRCIMIADSQISSSSCKAIQSTSKLTNAFHSCFSASWIYSKVVLLGISFLECEHRYAIYSTYNCLHLCLSFCWNCNPSAWLPFATTSFSKSSIATLSFSSLFYIWFITHLAPFDDILVPNDLFHWIFFFTKSNCPWARLL